MKTILFINFYSTVFCVEFIGKNFFKLQWIFTKESRSSFRKKKNKDLKQFLFEEKKYN